MKAVCAPSILLSAGLLLSFTNLSAQKITSNEVDKSETGTTMSDTRTPERNKEIVRKLYADCFNTGKTELLNQVIAEDYEGVNGRKGPSAFAETIKLLRQGFPDARWTVEDLVAEGDRVAVRWGWQGIHKASFRGFPASQRKVTTENGMAIYQFRDGKVIRTWVQTDQLGFLQQIDVVPRDLRSAPQPPR